MIVLKNVSFYITIMSIFIQSYYSSELIKLCGEGHKENICDPVNILKNYDRKDLNDKLIRTIQLCAPTPPPSYDDDEEDENNKKFTCRCGIHSYLVISRNIVGRDAEKKSQANILANRILATKENSKCSVVLFASVEEKIFGIAVGEDAKEYIPDTCLIPIYKSADIGNFTFELDKKIEEFLQIKEQEHTCHTDVPVDDNNLRNKVAIPILLLLAALITAIVVAIFIVHRRKQKRSLEKKSPEGETLNSQERGLLKGLWIRMTAHTYPGIQDLVQERIFPFVQQVVGFLGIDIPAEEHQSKSDNEETQPQAAASTASATACSAASPSKEANDSTASKPSTTQEASVVEDADEEGSDQGREKLGSLQFSLSYSCREATLTLKVIRANDLAAKDMSGTSDPYVKIMLLPDKKRKLTTKIKRRNLNPRWNETFAFEGFPYEKLVSRTLYMQVLDYDRFSRDDPIGEVCLSLGELDLSKTHNFTRILQPCKGHGGKLGELQISLNYQANVGVISIGALRARNLKAKDINGLSDPYVKIWMAYDGKKVKKKKVPTATLR